MYMFHMTLQGLRRNLKCQNLDSREKSDRISGRQGDSSRQGVLRVLEDEVLVSGGKVLSEDLSAPRTPRILKMNKKKD